MSCTQNIPATYKKTWVTLAIWSTQPARKNIYCLCHLSNVVLFCWCVLSHAGSCQDDWWSEVWPSRGSVCNSERIRMVDCSKGNPRTGTLIQLKESYRNMHTIIDIYTQTKTCIATCSIDCYRLDHPPCYNIGFSLCYRKYECYAVALHVKAYWVLSVQSTILLQLLQLHPPLWFL